MKHVTPGFTDPVHHAQQSFRALLTALAEPGTVQTIASDIQFHGISRATTAAILTLCDHTTPLYISQHLASPALLENIAFHTSAPITQEKSQAEFALLQVQEFEDISEYRLGSESQPQLSCTFLLQCQHTESPLTLSLSGPGIDQARNCQINGLTDAQVAMLQVNHQQFPQGYDCFFFHNNQVTALPRSTAIELEAACTLR